MTRLDVHRPSALVPADYDFVSLDYHGGNPFEAIAMLGERQRFRAHMERTGGHYAQHQNSGSCHICGARAAWIAKFHHRPSNTYITTGMDCAEKMEMGDARAFAHWKKRVQTEFAAQKGKLKAMQFLTEQNLQWAWICYVNPSVSIDITRGSLKKEEGIIIDMVGKLVKYGPPMSDKQIAFLTKLVNDIDGRAARIAAFRQRDAGSVHVGEVGKRIEMELTVRYVKMFESDFGHFFINSCVDNLGNIVVYKGSKELAAKGEKVKVKATIKKHDDYKGTKQTVINRPVVL